MNGQRRQLGREGGFTLIELLMSIVIVGILTVVAVVGLTGLQEKGQTAACATSLDAARSATELYYSVTGGKYPRTFTDLTKPPRGRPLLDPAAGIIQGPTTLVGRGGNWTVTMIPGATTTDRTTYTGCTAGGT
jgi:prepilin-type N-terminal cleavage/methylation domain-containing protein